MGLRDDLTVMSADRRPRARCPAREQIGRVVGFLARNDVIDATNLQEGALMHMIGQAQMSVDLVPKDCWDSAGPGLSSRC